MQGGLPGTHLGPPIQQRGRIGEVINLGTLQVITTPYSKTWMPNFVKYMYCTLVEISYANEESSDGRNFRNDSREVNDKFLHFFSDFIQSRLPHYFMNPN